MPILLSTFQLNLFVCASSGQIVKHLQLKSVIIILNVWVMIVLRQDVFIYFFFAGCKYSDVELFLGGFSCFLIEFGITSIIVPIFLLCKMFSKIFGSKSWFDHTIFYLFKEVTFFLYSFWEVNRPQV